MRILHLGGYNSITDSVAAQQSALGHDVLCLGVSSPNAILHIPSALREIACRTRQLAGQRFDIVQFHLTESLASDDLSALPLLGEVLSALKATGARLCLNTYGEDPVANTESRQSLGLHGDLLQKTFHHLFIGSADNLQLNQEIPSWSWLSPGLDFKALPVTRPEEPAPQRLRILHIPHRVKPAETSCLVDVLTGLSSERNLFNLEVAPPETISTRSDLTAALMRCDLFIEQLDRQSYGYLAIQALAHGKTVLSGNSKATHQIWDQLTTCPVLDTTRQNLKARIESILHEPRCLRDLGKRSRQYAEKYHNVAVTSRVMLSTYESLLS